MYTLYYKTNSKELKEFSALDTAKQTSMHGCYKMYEKMKNQVILFINAKCSPAALKQLTNAIAFIGDDNLKKRT